LLFSDAGVPNDDPHLEGGEKKSEINIPKPEEEQELDIAAIQKAIFKYHSFIYSSANLEHLSQGALTEEEEAALMTTYHYTGATTNIHPYLSQLVNYAQPVKFQGFDVAEGWYLLILCLLNLH
jgi:phosphatidylinositol phospholipase C beta